MRVPTIFPLLAVLFFCASPAGAAPGTGSPSSRVDAPKGKVLVRGLEGEAFPGKPLPPPGPPVEQSNFPFPPPPEAAGSAFEAGSGRSAAGASFGSTETGGARLLVLFRALGEKSFPLFWVLLLAFLNLSALAMAGLLLARVPPAQPVRPSAKPEPRAATSATIHPKGS